MWWSASIPSLRPQPLSNQIVTVCHTGYLHFAQSKPQIMLHPKIASISLLRLQSEDLQGLVHGMPYRPERWNGCRRSQRHNMKWVAMCNLALTEMNKVTFRWPIFSSLFSGLWAALDDKRHLSTAQSLTCSMMLNQDKSTPSQPPHSWIEGVSFLQQSITFLGHTPK